MSCDLSMLFHLDAKFCNVYQVFKWLQSSLGVYCLEALTERNFFYTVSVHIFPILGTALQSLSRNPQIFFFLIIDLFHLMLIIIWSSCKWKRCNCCSFHMSPKSSFFQSKTHILWLLFIMMRTLEFFNRILISTSITNSRNDGKKERSKNKLSLEKKLVSLGFVWGQILNSAINGQRWQVEGWRSADV